ncbi:MAG: hypothetical protein JWQ13_2823, partial [Ramlibacter sp.]|nr:hypothetical protein [Ramlibacter sp.]
MTGPGWLSRSTGKLRLDVVPPEAASAASPLAAAP